MARINGKKVLTVNNTVYMGENINLDATPKGVYANLAALQAAYPTGAEGVYLTSDNGHWYFYQNGWQDGGVYQATDIGYKQINFDKTNFVEYIHNFYDYNTMTTQNKFLDYDYDNSQFIEYDNNNFSYLIVPIETKHKYIISGTNYRGWLTNSDLTAVYTYFGDYSQTQTNIVIDNTTLGGTKLVININKNVFDITKYMVLAAEEMSANYISYQDNYYIFTKDNNYLIKSTNLFDKTTMLGGNNKIYEYSNGSMIEVENNYFYYLKIPINELGNYIITCKSYTGFALDINGQYVASIGDYNYQSKFVYNVNNINIRYLIINIRYTDCEIDSFQCNKGNTILPYEKYYKPYYSLENAKREYYVTPNTALNFIDTIKYLTNDKTEKTIYIAAGTYDLFEEFGGSAYAQTITSDMTMVEANPIIPLNTKVIGLGYVELRFTPTQEQIGETAALILSPINITGSVYLENLTIIADNCRYCIHDESGGDVNLTGSHKSYKNIYLKKTMTTSYGHAQAYACGFDKDFTFEFENCVFDGVIAFSMHNRDAGTNNIVIKNSVFKSAGTNPSMRFGSVWVQHNIVTISGCYINNDVKLISETGEDKQSAFDITLINCSGNYQCTTDTHTTNQYGFKDYK